MHPLLKWARKNQPALIELIRVLVECESPTDSPEGVNRCINLLADSIRDIADCRTIATNASTGRILVCRFRLSGRRTSRILALGHSDTVWPIGTLGSMPFRQRAGKLWGPGVLDMKAGLALFVFAVRALIENNIACGREVTLLVNPDEETGSAASRTFTEKLAREAECVIVLEPGAGTEGHVKTSRKGTGAYRIEVHGTAAHAGVDFEKGASAIVELSRQIAKIAEFTDPKRGITVNPGVISGGTRANVIAAQASVEIDVRVARTADAKLLAKNFAALKPFDRRCRMEVTGGLRRPPMERTPRIAQLYRKAHTLAAELGIALGESATGGGSDGNFTAALGIPTLDGIGAVGEGAHAVHENVRVDRLADRMALLALLVSR